MAQLEIKELPDDLMQQLAVRAAEHGRSIEAEAVECITEAVQPRPVENDRDEARRRLAEIRRRLSDRGVLTTPEEIEAAINFGRE